MLPLFICSSLILYRVLVAQHDFLHTFILKETCFLFVSDRWISVSSRRIVSFFREDKTTTWHISLNIKFDKKRIKRHPSDLRKKISDESHKYFVLFVSIRAVSGQWQGSLTMTRLRQQVSRLLLVFYNRPLFPPKVHPKECDAATVEKGRTSQEERRTRIWITCSAFPFLKKTGQEINITEELEKKMRKRGKVLRPERLTQEQLNNNCKRRSISSR